MNIEKVKNYNQKLLAVLGTVVVLIAIVGVISISYFTINEINNRNLYDTQEDGILSDEKIELLQKENKRQQIISYEQPKLVDTLNLIYIIPVSHKTLNKAELMDEGGVGLMSIKSENYYGGIDVRYSEQYYGDYNNLLIYDFKNNTTEKLFSERINFRAIQTKTFEDDILILFKASTKDTYKDGVVNQRDYKVLFIYSIREKKIRSIKLDSADVYQINFVENSKDILIEFGIDYNKDGTFDEYSEPSLIKKYNFEFNKLEDILSKELTEELQMKLEGSDK